MRKFTSSVFLTVVFGLYALTKNELAPTGVNVSPDPPLVTSGQIVPSNVVSDTSTSPPISSSSSPKLQVAAKPKLASIPASAPVVASDAPPVPPRSSSSSAKQGMYKDGTYTSPSVDAYYGNIQIQVSVQGGEIASVHFIDYPQDRGRSISINSYAMPTLKSEVIRAQTAPVDAVSGATYTSQAFNQSLASVLAQARA